MNNFVQVELNQRYSNDDVFLLALSGQVPVDKLLIRLQNVKKTELRAQVDAEEEEVKNPLDMLISDASDDSEIYQSSSQSESENLQSEKSWDEETTS